MIVRQNSEASGKRTSPLGGLVKALFVAFLTVMLFLLVRSMARHHFLGGSQDNSQTKSSNP
jgi:hypothetical protein